MLAVILRATRQRALRQRVLAGTAAAWQTLQPAGTAPRSSGGLADSSHSSDSLGGRDWLSSTGGLGGGITFSSSAVVASSPGESGSGGGSSSKGKRKPGPRTETIEPQPQLQAWLQQEQGLSAKAADQHARRLALVFGSLQAALDSLPATFEWCRSRGLTGLQTAKVLDRIAKARRENVVQFATLAQPVWQQLESYIAAWAEQERQAGDSKMRKNTSLAEVLCSRDIAADALVMPPGHVEAWLAAVSQRLPAAAIGRLLLAQPNMVSGSPATALAAISWAADVLGVADPAAFFARSPSLLTREVFSLQRNLDSLQQALGWTAQRAQQLVVKQPMLLGCSPATVLAALAWLWQLFPDAQQLVAVADRGPQLLFRTVQRLQGNADTLRAALGWQDGDGQLAAFVAAYPQPFATVNLSGKSAADKLRLLTQVVGLSTERCLSEGTTYLKTGLPTMAAHYMLVQERGPHALFAGDGSISFSWIINVEHVIKHCRISRQERNAFVREWPRSEQGRRLLEGLRAGSTTGWPRPIVPHEVSQRDAAEAEQRQHSQAARHNSKAGAMDSKRQGRGRPRKGSRSSGGTAGEP